MRARRFARGTGVVLGRFGHRAVTRVTGVADSPPVSTVPGRPLHVVAGGGLRKYEGSIYDAVGRSGAQLYNPLETLRLFRDYNPDAAMAVWNFLRLVNPSYTITAKMLPDRTEVDEEGTAMLRARTDALLGVYGRDYGGGLFALINVMTLTLITQGAVVAELELSENLKDVLDWCPADPRLVTFRRDKETGHFVPTVDWQGQAYTLPEEQFRYVPFDPDIGNPYGRSPMWPALEATFFQVEVLRDLKMVAHYAGHPRMGVKVLEEIATRHMPQHYEEPGNEEKARAWLDNWIDSITAQYKTLRPDDAFIHWDWVEPASLDAGRPSYDLTSLIKVVEHQVSSALKHLPILLGRTEGQGLAHGSIQWQIFAQGVRSIQQTVGAIAAWWGTQTLRIWGRQSVAEVEFPPIRTQDRLREAQSEALEVATAIKKFLMGWVTNEELAEEFAGHAPVAEPDILSVLGKPEMALALMGGEAEGEGETAGTEEGEGEKALLKLQLEEAFGMAGGNGRGGGLDDQICRLLNGNGFGKREYGASVVESERGYFDKLPSWMRGRVKRERDSVIAFSTIRRDRVADDLGEEE